jgi:ankyrin
MDLIEAVQENNVESVKAIIADGGDVNLSSSDNSGRTVLYWASSEGCVECVNVLLEAKADTEKADRFGYTPLHVASRNGYLQCVKLLISHKANINARSRIGYSPLHCAASSERLECIKVECCVCLTFLFFIHQ